MHKPAFNPKDAIESSLEKVVAQIGDPSELVYQRLYIKAPSVQALFSRDTHGTVRGEMFQQVIEAVMDLSDKRRYAEHQIASEWTNHQGLGVPPEHFRLIFLAMIEVFEEVLGEAWSPEMQSAWHWVLAEVDGIIDKAAAKP